MFDPHAGSVVQGDAGAALQTDHLSGGSLAGGGQGSGSRGGYQARPTASNHSDHEINLLGPFVFLRHSEQIECTQQWLIVKDDTSRPSLLF